MRLFRAVQHRQPVSSSMMLVFTLGRATWEAYLYPFGFPREACFESGTPGTSGVGGHAHDEENTTPLMIFWGKVIKTCVPLRGRFPR